MKIIIEAKPNENGNRLAHKLERVINAMPDLPGAYVARHSGDKPHDGQIAIMVREAERECAG